KQGSVFRTHSDRIAEGATRTGAPLGMATRAIRVGSCVAMLLKMNRNSKRCGSLGHSEGTSKLVRFCGARLRGRGLRPNLRACVVCTGDFERIARANHAGENLGLAIGKRSFVGKRH